MSARKLAIVRYNKSSVDFEDDSAVASLICHLDELFLERKTEEWHVSFMDEKNGDSWNAKLEEYLRASGLQSMLTSPRRTIVEQLLNNAIDVIYSQTANVHDLTAGKALKLREEKKNEQSFSQNPLNRMDLSSPIIQERIRDLCKTMGIIDCPNQEALLRAVCLFIEENLTDEHLSALKKEQESGKQPKLIGLEEFPVGVADLKDKSLNGVARILRLLSVDSLRETQTKVNETLVAIQNLTVTAKKV